MNEEQINAFPESIRDWDEVKNSDTPEVFWDRISNMRSKFGTALFKPGEDAGEEGWGKFTNKAIELSDGKLMPRPDLEDKEQREALFKALGRPAEPSGYEFADIEEVPLDEDRKKFLTETAFEIGLTKAQLKALDEKVRSAEASHVSNSRDAFNNGIKELKQEWGLTFEEREHAAKKVAASFFPHLPQDTAFSAQELKAFHSIAKQLGSEGKEFMQQKQSEGTMTPQMASEKIAEIRNNKDHPYNNPQSAGHAEATKKMRNLYLIKNGLPQG